MDWIFSSDQLMNLSPSKSDGISFELEKGYRSKTAWFIEELGKELKFGRLVVSTAQVLAHRFYVYQSFKQHDRYIISVASLFLAGKVEESMIKYKHLQVIVRTYLMYRKKMNSSFDADLKETEKKVLVAERILLQTLCFDVQVTHPYADSYKKIKNSLKSYISDDIRRDFHQVVVNMINDSYRTTLCLQHSPEHIGIGAIFLATLYMSLQPLNARSKDSTWFEILDSDIEEDDLKNICEQMLEAYADASSSSLDKSRVIDAKKVATARSKLQHMFNPARDLKGLPYCDSASLSTSPNTVTHPLSVSHSYGSAHSLHEGASEGIVHGLPYASSSAAFDQLYKNGRSDDMDESNMDNQGQLDRDLPTDLKQSKRKFDSESGLGDVATSFKRVHADTSPPPPPPSESPSITTGVSSALPVLKSYPVGYHSVSVSVSISSRNSSAALVDEDDVPPPPPPDDFTASASTPLIST